MNRRTQAATIVVALTAVIAFAAVAGAGAGAPATTPTATHDTTDTPTPTATHNTTDACGETPTNETAPASPPASVEFEMNEELGILAVYHGGGDPITANNTGQLRVDHSGATSVNWRGGSMYGDTYHLHSDTIREGDLIVALRPVEPGGWVNFVWESPDGETTLRLGDYYRP